MVVAPLSPILFDIKPNEFVEFYNLSDFIVPNVVICNVKFGQARHVLGNEPCSSLANFQVLDVQLLLLWQFHFKFCEM